MQSRRLAAVALLLMAVTLFAAPFVGAAGITVRTDTSSYTGAQSLTASGTVSPAPGPGTAAFLKISNPAGTSVAVDNAPVDGSTGSYQDTFILGGSASWTAGTYTITATWGNSGSTAPVNASATFTYSPTTTTTTTTSQTATTTTVTTTVTTVSTSTTTSTTTSTATSVSTTTLTTTSVSVQTSTLTSTSTTTTTTSALVLSSDTVVLLGAVFLVAIIALVGVVLVRRR